MNNITNVAGIFFVKTIYSALLSLFSILTMTPFPFIPIQITLIDLVIEGYPSFFLSFEPSHMRIQGAFLPTVIKRAFPFALMILISCLVITPLSPMLGIPGPDASTVMYYITGFVGILAVFKACRPFNKLRIFLSATVMVGFYTAVYLFTGILNLELLTKATLPLFLGLAVLCIPLRMLLDCVATRIFAKKSAVR